VAAFRAAIDADFTLTECESAFRFVRADGEQRWLVKRGRILRDGRGAPVRVTGVIADQTLQRTAERRAAELMSELQHRIKNILSVVRSLSQRTLETAETLEDYGAHFDGRLGAMARVEGTLALSREAGVDLDQMLREEFLRHAAREGQQFEIAGEPVLLAGRTAELFALALHELAVNAVKFGALSARNGKVAVSWDVGAGGARIDLAWQESGVPVLLTDPLREGFGRRLIEQGLPYQLGAETQFRLEPGGLRCDIGLPLTQGQTP
jgi:two-component sensor histidine kinase